MLNILYEDAEILVVKKPVGMESQSAKGFEPDMVSEIKNYFNRLSTKPGEPYVGVIHRLDKPVSGAMVYAKTQRAAGALSKQVQDGSMQKRYYAVLCGKPVDIVGKCVDFLLRDSKNNCSKVVDKGITGGKRAELNYRVLKTLDDGGEILSLAEIELLTGRHHQIRVQMSHMGTPVWGDNKYNPAFNRMAGGTRRGSVALCACGLSFVHPGTGKRMDFRVRPEGEIFGRFGYEFEEWSKTGEPGAR